MSKDYPCIIPAFIYSYAYQIRETTYYHYMQSQGAGDGDGSHTLDPASLLVISCSLLGAPEFDSCLIIIYQSGVYVTNVRG
jgi:hypothetical protein